MFQQFRVPSRRKNTIQFCVCVCARVESRLHAITRPRRGHGFSTGGNKGTPTMKMSEKRKKPTLEWRGHGGKGRNKANIGEQIGK